MRRPPNYSSPPNERCVECGPKERLGLGGVMGCESRTGAWASPRAKRYDDFPQPATHQATPFGQTIAIFPCGPSRMGCGLVVAIY